MEFRKLMDFFQKDVLNKLSPTLSREEVAQQLDTDEKPLRNSIQYTNTALVHRCTVHSDSLKIMGENGKYTNDVQNTKNKICTSKTDVQIFRLECLRKRYYDFRITRNENEKIVVSFFGL